MEEPPAVHVGFTALEEFWDDSAVEILVVSECCLWQPRRDVPDGRRVTIARNPWVTPEDSRRGYAFSQSQAHAVLPGIAAALAEATGTDSSLDRWRILLWGWLFHYTDALYDRYLRLSTLITDHPSARFLGLHESAYGVPASTIESVEWLKTDEYNLQVYTDVAVALGLCVERKRPLEPLVRPSVVSPDGGALKALARRAVSAVGAAAPLKFKNVYLHPAPEMGVMLGMGLRAWQLSAPPHPRFAGRVDPDLRHRALGGLEAGDDPFMRILCAGVARDLPTCFLEDFEQVGEYVRRGYPRSARVIWSCNSWYFDEPFKRWAAEQKASGARILGMQHGGGYGCLADHASEEHEQAIADVYYTWGWKKGGVHAEVKPMPATKLIGIERNASPEPPIDKFLFVCTGEPRYLIELPIIPERVLARQAWQERFHAALSQPLRERLVARLHYEDMGWDAQKRWRSFAPEVTIQTAEDMPFQKAVYSHRLLVIDHLCTTYLEALAGDRPTLLFWDPANYPLRSEAEGLYDRLVAAGVLHYDPESAARKLVGIYEDVEGWWRSEKVQSARDAFCRTFARTSPTALNEWSEELRAQLS